MCNGHAELVSSTGECCELISKRTWSSRTDGNVSCASGCGVGTSIWVDGDGPSCPMKVSPVLLQNGKQERTWLSASLLPNIGLMLADHLSTL